jgi:hypothetical protein
VADELLTYSLVFEGFSLEFDIRVQRSTAETHAFQRGKPSDFAFVVSDIWLKSGHRRCLVSSEFNTGNLIEALRDLSAAFGAPEKLGAAGSIIPLSGLCAWMREYWSRVDEDRAVADDEANHDCLTHFCVIAEDTGCIAIYDRDGVPTIEVSAQVDDEAGPLMVHAKFSPAAAAQETVQLRQALAEIIRERMTVQ